MSQLENLLRECTVKLTIPGQRGWGTGFFVAPGLILTCAHVVQGANGQSIQVLWQNQENWAQAVVERLLANPYDLALLRVTLPSGANPPCVHLDEAIQSRDPLYLFGYPDEGDPHGEPRTFNCDGITGSEIASILFNLGQVRPGMSGSPLLNQQTGKVCGIVKFTRDRSIDLGGGAIPTRVIFEQFPELRDLQQAFHGSDRRWSNSATRQSGIDFQPYLKAIASTYAKWWKFYTLIDVEGRQEQAEDESPIFDFGLMVQTVKEEEPEQQQQQKQPEIERFPVLEGIRKYAEQHVLLVGRPGSGKSTALARLLLEEATTNPPKIPVLVELRYWQGSLSDLLHNSITRYDPTLKAFPLETLLAHTLLLFDGVNELPSEEARSQLATFRSHNPNIPMIFTTRDLGLGGDLGIEKRLEMQPLTEAQMKVFIRAYVPEQADLMLRQLSDRLREFGQTPLLLWMLCEVFQQSPSHQMPSNLAEVFRKFTAMYEASSVRKHEVALLKGDVRPLSDRRLWKPALQALASAMMQGETPVDFRIAIHRGEAEKQLSQAFPNEKFPVRDVLDDLLKYHLLQNHSTDQIEFRHQLLQEYYAAEYLLRILPHLSDEQLKRDYLNYLKWTEPLALMLALVAEEALALRVVKLAMNDVDLMLGARFSGEVQPAFQDKTVGWLSVVEMPPSFRCQCWATSHSKTAIPGLLKALEDPESGVRLSAAEVLGQIGTVEAIAGLLKALEDPESGVRLSAAEALGKLGTVEAIAGLLKALEDPESNVRLSAAEALGKLGTVEAIPALLKALEHSKSYVRWSAVEALGKFGTVETTPGLLKALKHSESNVRWSATEALGKLGTVEAIPGLLKALEDPESNVRLSAAEALGKLGMVEAIPELLKALEHAKSYVRLSATEALGELGTVEAVPGLLKALEDPASGVRLSAAEALGKLGTVEAILGLLKALEHSESGVRWSTVETLGKLGTVEAVPGLLKALEDSKSYVRRSAVEALGKLGTVEAVPGLLKAIEHPKSYVRRSAVEALGKLGTVEAVPGLLKALEDPESGVRLSAATVLGKFGTVEAIPGLLKALEDPKSYVRLSAATVLGQIGTVEAIPGLLKALEDLKSYVRRNAVEALGQIGTVEAIPGLLKALEDPESNVRLSAAAVLGKLGTVEVIPGLLKALEDAEPYVRKSAAEVLGKLGTVEAIPGLLKALKDVEPYVRRSAAEALGKLGTVEVISPLIQALHNSDIAVCEIAVEALGKIGGERVATVLMQLSQERGNNISSIAIKEALGKIAVEASLTSLTKAWIVMALVNDLQSNHSTHYNIYDIRQNAINALGKIGNSQPLANLWEQQLISSKTDIYSAIAAIQNRCKYYNHEIFHGLIPQGKAIALYFSYAPKDEDLRNELEKHLSNLKQQGVITSWDQHQILPGEETERVVSDRLNAADIILLLISPDSMADENCYDKEIRWAVEHHQAGEARVIPILLRPVDWTAAPFSQLPILPKNHKPITTWENRDEAFREIAEGIREVAIELRKAKS